MVKIHNILSFIQFKPTEKVTSVINFQEDKVSPVQCDVRLKLAEKATNQSTASLFSAPNVQHHNTHTKMGIQEKWQPMLESHQIAVKLKVFSL